MIIFQYFWNHYIGVVVVVVVVTMANGIVVVIEYVLYYF